MTSSTPTRVGTNLAGKGIDGRKPQLYRSNVTARTSSESDLDDSGVSVLGRIPLSSIMVIGQGLVP
jgi:hypothetical protein